ncbi:GTPase domain-containing protein [Winogradskyella alexanderae]|uniref:GTPase domain-containing protein n=1 Tax=Winogradskyella alexanderae TaxID=2877123 RepID=A0ABS7XV22_9FLAO|nr:GTPase domain-containing protein [Winogradskyella alexanderae]MCA0133870.1 GTPase domain-containing protein [Winogradskyella alexanderae]
MPEPVSTIGATISVADKAIDVVKTYAPKYIDWARTKLFGKRIILIGPGEAGKSSFIDYLLFGELTDEGDTSRNIAVKKTGLLNLNYGRNEQYTLRLKYAIDTVGQTGATNHALLAYEQNPHAMIIVFDSTEYGSSDKNKDALIWSKEFTEQFERQWINNSSNKKNKLKGIIVVLNKLDKLTEDDKSYDDMLEELKPVFKTLVNSTKNFEQRIRFKKGVFVKSKFGVEFANAVLSMTCKLFV